MILDIEEPRLLVVSDLHLGNPSSSARRRLVEFLDYAEQENASVCINGDGFELLQTNLQTLAAETVAVINRLKRLLQSGQRVYYVVGNHDILLEHFLEDWLFTHISPFLNVTSGESRIRVEHGHLYDPFFASHPGLYELSTRAARYLLFASPDVYSLWSRAQAAVDRRRRRTESNGGGVSAYHEAAATLLERGFDAVVFGHTHIAEELELDRGTYLNCGNWLESSTYVDIADGKASLCRWISRGAAGVA